MRSGQHIEYKNFNVNNKYIYFATVIYSILTRTRTRAASGLNKRQALANTRNSPPK